MCATIGVCGWARADDAGDVRAGRGDKAAPDALWAFLKAAHNSISHPGDMSSQGPHGGTESVDLRLCDLTEHSPMTARASKDNCLATP